MLIYNSLTNEMALIGLFYAIIDNDTNSLVVFVRKSVCVFV